MQSVENEILRDEQFINFNGPEDDADDVFEDDFDLDEIETEDFDEDDF